VPLKTERAKLDSKGRIVLPSDHRKSFGFKGEVNLEVVPTRVGLLIRRARPEPDHWQRAIGALNRHDNPFRSLTTQEYMDLIRHRD
jgi:bifunctional DNA-binding transcriptional regulator/antitoxin component of YhaV-PrlF toxin-antitoxin module